MNTVALKKLKTVLTGKQLKIAVAESVTCGRLQAALGSISGSSAFFEGGMTAYNLRQKIRLLSIGGRHAESVNSVSQQVAFELAAGACRLFQTGIGIGTTGYAEPSPENGIHEPVAYFAICRLSHGKIENILGEQIPGVGLSRIRMQKRVTETALQALLRYAENCEASDNNTKQ